MVFGFGQSYALGGWRMKPPGGRDSAFLQTQFPEQFVFGGKADKIEVNGFHLAPGGPLAGKQNEQQRGNQGAVKRDGHAARRLGQPMALAQDGFEPLEKERLNNLC